MTSPLIRAGCVQGGGATRAGGVQLDTLVWSVTPAYVGAHSRKINLFIAGGLVSRYA